MRSASTTWTPRYSLSPAVARLLMSIEAARADVEHMHFTPTVEAELRHRARVRSTHYSTRIEGNRLTLEQAYGLTAIYRQYIGSLSAMRQGDTAKGTSGR